MKRALTVLVAIGSINLHAHAAAGESDDDEALTAVFRHSVEELSRCYAKTKTICLSAASGDRAGRTVAKAEFPLVRGPAACPKVDVMSRQTDNVRLWFGGVMHTSPREVTIVRWVYRHPLDAEEGVFTLHLEGGRWVVVKWMQNWIS